jgi:hypothetical protein
MPDTMIALHAAGERRSRTRRIEQEHPGCACHPRGREMCAMANKTNWEDET